MQPNRFIEEYFFFYQKSKYRVLKVLKHFEMLFFGNYRHLLGSQSENNCLSRPFTIKFPHKKGGNVNCAFEINLFESFTKMYQNDYRLYCDGNIPKINLTLVVR